MLKLTSHIKFVIRAITQTRNASTDTKTISLRNIPSLVFGKYLLHTNIVSSGVLMWLGDICQQEIEYRQGKLKKRYDYGRMGKNIALTSSYKQIHSCFLQFGCPLWDWL